MSAGSQRAQAPVRRRHPRNTHALYLVPGALAFLAAIALPFAMNIWYSFTDWQGVGSPKWTGLDNYRQLFEDSQFWESFRHSLAMVLAMSVIPTTVGLVVAAALFDFVGKHFGS